MKKVIKVDFYTYTSRRVYLYAPPFYHRFLRPFTLERREYDIYAKTAIVLIETLKTSKFKGIIRFRVRPWYLWFWRAFLKGGFKSPVIVVNHRLLSSGEVPALTKLEEELNKAYRKIVFLED
ncbi:MAG: hypothetical protein M1355_03725 [Patescibacteria group bacterium]|nr:hypothetical protein [Patescibacteria group bacterium]